MYIESSIQVFCIATKQYFIYMPILMWNIFFKTETFFILLICIRKGFCFPFSWSCWLFKPFFLTAYLIQLVEFMVTSIESDRCFRKSSNPSINSTNVNAPQSTDSQRPAAHDDWARHFFEIRIWNADRTSRCQSFTRVRRHGVIVTTVTEVAAFRLLNFKRFFKNSLITSFVVCFCSIVNLWN